MKTDIKDLDLQMKYKLLATEIAFKLLVTRNLAGKFKLSRYVNWRKH
jgi:hypothetical protein